MRLTTNPEESPADLQAELQTLEARIADLPEPEATELYNRELFPLACLSVRMQAADRPRRRLAFIPVGTQPYSPILATLANPADRTVLLYTEGSRACLQALLESVPLENPSLREFKDDPNPRVILEIVESELAWSGRPSADQVAVDVTSGRKSTVATLGAVAAALGFLQSSLLSGPIPGKPHLHRSPRLVTLPDPGSFWGLRRRETARQLLKAGAFAAAESAFRELADISIRRASDEAMADCCRGLSLWLQGQGEPARLRVERAKKILGEPTGSILQSALAQLARDDREGFPRAARDAALLAKGGGKPTKGGPLHVAGSLAEWLEEKR